MVFKLVQLLVDTQERGCYKQASMSVEIFCVLQRKELVEKYDNTCKPLKPIIEECLITLCQHESRHNNRFSFKAFWNKYSTAAGVFLPPPDLAKAVIDANGDWDTCSSELSMLATGCKLGMELFLDDCPKIVCTHMDKFAQKVSSELVLQEEALRCLTCDSEE